MAKFTQRPIVQIVSGFAAVTAAALIGGAAIGYLEAEHGAGATDSPLLFTAFVAFAALVMVASIVLGARWMGAIDEAAREAHKASWFWGGSAGMAVGGVGLILTILPQSARLAVPALLGRTDPVIYLAAGAFGMLTLMLIGYGVVWAWWWLARR